MIEAYTDWPIDPGDAPDASSPIRKVRVLRVAGAWAVIDGGHKVPIGYLYKAPSRFRHAAVEPFTAEELSGAGREWLDEFKALVCEAMAAHPSLDAGQWRCTITDGWEYEIALTNRPGSVVIVLRYPNLDNQDVHDAAVLLAAKAARLAVKGALD